MARGCSWGKTFASSKNGVRTAREGELLSWADFPKQRGSPLTKVQALTRSKVCTQSYIPTTDKISLKAVTYIWQKTASSRTATDDAFFLRQAGPVPKNYSLSLSLSQEAATLAMSARSQLMHSILSDPLISKESPIVRFL